MGATKKKTHGCQKNIITFPETICISANNLGLNPKRKFVNYQGRQSRRTLKSSDWHELQTLIINFSNQIF